jgi:hypothetical protein
MKSDGLASFAGRTLGARLRGLSRGALVRAAGELKSPLWACSMIG